MMAVLGFLGGDETGSPEHCEFGGVSLVLRRGECGHRRNSRIVAQDFVPRSKEHTFSVTSCPVAKEQGVFLDRSGQGISEHSLDVGNEVLVASENPIEDSSHFGQASPGPTVVILVMRSRRS